MPWYLTQIFRRAVRHRAIGKWDLSTLLVPEPSHLEQVAQTVDSEERERNLHKDVHRAVMPQAGNTQCLSIKTTDQSHVLIPRSVYMQWVLHTVCKCEFSTSEKVEKCFCCSLGVFFFLSGCVSVYIYIYIYMDQVSNPWILHCKADSFFFFCKANS